MAIHVKTNISAMTRVIPTIKTSAPPWKNCRTLTLLDFLLTIYGSPLFFESVMYLNLLFLPEAFLKWRLQVVCWLHQNRVFGVGQGSRYQIHQRPT